ncbi:MAG: hypothetical protein C0391_08560 [Anaerolinea sp.]|nr:hypothetical protein [Anaerolinea sp.]
MPMKKFSFLLFVSLLLGSSGCAPVATMQTPTLAPLLTATRTPFPPARTPTPTSTFTQVPTVTPTLDPAAHFEVSSPLADILLEELSTILSGSFIQPAPGLDDGHHGSDFAYYRHGKHDTMLGLPVYSLLNGIVVGVTSDKKPYGNLVIIETSLQTIPKDFLSLLAPPTELNAYPYNPRMQYCPGLKEQNWTGTVGSLYILYGHLIEPTPLDVGDEVASGQLVGGVGNTGLSGNPHLHLEMRWGSSGTKFASMGYYDTAAAQEEMLEYCNWRISGRFVLQDPMAFLASWAIYSQSQ